MTFPNGTSGYQIGAGNINEPVFMRRQPVLRINGGRNLTAIELLCGLIEYYGASDADITLPSGADIEAAFPNMPINGSFEMAILTNATGKVTIITNTGLKLDGLEVVPASGRSANLMIYKTDIEKYTIYIMQ
jgi:hypothetical protein